MPSTPATIDPALTYEQAQAELESIIEKMDSGGAGLEQSIALYERGVALLKHCRGILERAEQRFVDLSAQVQGGGTEKGANPAKSGAPE